jgi:hypothetical protein
MAFTRRDEENDQILEAQRSNLATKSANNPYAPQNATTMTGPATTGVLSTPNPNQRRDADPSSKALSTFGSNEWYGGLDEYGGISASNSPGVFWDLYGQEKLGLNAGSATAQFYNENYNPYLLGQAYGQKNFGMDDRLAQGTWLGNQLAQPGMTFFDPGQMVTSILSQIAQAGNGGQGSSQFNELSAVAIGPPDQQLAAILNFLGETLKSAMPADTLQAYLGWVQQIGMEVVSDAMKNGIAGFERGGGNIATALMQRLGPTGGL